MNPHQLPELIGPGSAQDLRDLICKSCDTCNVKGRPHCRLLGQLLVSIDGPRFCAAGEGYVVCPQHGVQFESHRCEWGFVVDSNGNEHRG